MLVIPNTEVRLLSNVPLTPTYEHVMDFTSNSEQASYFISKTAHTFTDFTYVREAGTIRVPRSRDSLYACNYLMFRNNDFSGKWFYAFISKLDYVNPNTTEIHFELDVFQTWQFDFTLRTSFVEREHMNRWNGDGSPVIHTIDEGLDYGSMYETVSVEQYQPYNGVFFLVIVATERMDTNGSGVSPVINGAPQPLTYYIHPFKLDGTVPPVSIMGININLSPVSSVLQSLYKNTKAVNNIACLYVTEYLGFDMVYSNGAFSLPNMSTFEHVTIQDDTNTFNTLRLVNLPNYSTKTATIGGKYDGFHIPTESKLLMYPYAVTILTDMKGNQQEIRNEYIQSSVLEIVTKGSIGTSNKVSYHIKNYALNESMNNGSEVAIEHAVINNSPNDIPVVTDLLSAYLQGNRNSLENQKNAIVFNGVANAIGNVFGGIGQSLARNPIGAVGATSDMARGFASTYFQLEGLQAKQKDIDTTPSQISKMGGNTAFDYGNDYRGVYIVKKQIPAERRAILSDFFKMFGYKCNRVKTPNTRTRQHFNFIKTVGANITGDVPQEDLVRIKRIFDNGVTIWHTSDVGNYGLANGEI